MPKNIFQTTIFIRLLAHLDAFIRALHYYDALHDWVKYLQVQYKTK